MFSQSAEKIYHEIKKARTIVLLPHQDPDADALGSLLALYESLIYEGKQVYLYSMSMLPKKLSFLPYFYDLSVKVPENKIDLIITLDSGDFERSSLPNLKKYNPHFEGTPIINIDHHPTNTYFGDINLVQTKASSTCEILYTFFEYNKMHISTTMATNLLAGILFDTGNFSNSATQYSSLVATSELITRGGDYAKVQSHLFKDTSIKMLKLWGKIFARMEKHEELDIIYTYVKQEDLKEFGLSEEEAGSITNFLNTIQEGVAGLIFKEKANNEGVKVGLRTTKNHIDVSAIASHFGGGGHKKASGFSLSGSIEEAIEQTFEAMTHKVEWKGAEGLS